MVGAGPAGSSAARAAAAAGARVVVLDRAAFPRYKTCGGGLIGPSLAALPGAPPTRASITRVSLSLAGGRRRTRTVDRAVPADGHPGRARRLAAVRGGRGGRRGAGALPGAVGVRRRRRRPTPDRCGPRWSSPPTARRAGWPARSASGCRGSTSAWSSSSRPAATAAEWADRVHLDWGPIPGSYAWVFPKGDTLTVGVIAARGAGDATRGYLRASCAGSGSTASASSTTPAT